MNEDSPPVSFLSTEPTHSPQSAVDCASLTNSMNKNKESLKVKLMLRRPIDVLVDQGILPPPKSSASFYEQKHKLERAKTGDFLKHKIQRRPQRTELVQQHILEESFDPSYYEEERKLKKARLADDLNERLSQRPGPLELIKGNILHTDESLEQAIKEGQITFKKTCEGEIIKNPPKRFVFEEESSSDSAPSPTHNVASANASLTTTTSSTANLANYQLNNSYLVTNNNNFQSLSQNESACITTANATPTINDTTNDILKSNNLNNLSYIVATPVTNLLPSTTSTTPVFASNQKDNTTVNETLTPNTVNLLAPTSQCDAINKTPVNNLVAQANITSQVISQYTKSKKKVKSKSQPRTRVIKFHEYTGPPNVKKQSNSSQAHVETSYELLLKQQQLFLQWQLECQQKYPHLSSQNVMDDDASLKEVSNAIVNNNPSISSERDCNRNSSERDEPSGANVLKTKPNNNYVTLGQSQMTNNNESTGSSECVLSPTANDLPSNGSLNSNNVNSVKQCPPMVKKIISKLEDMKVSDLKAELKKRNLPVSGAKQQLIERLKPFSESVVSDNNSIVTAELTAGTTIFNFADCNKTNNFTSVDMLTSKGNLTTMQGNTLPGSLSGSTTFLLKNNITNELKKGGNKEYVLITNSTDNRFSTVPLQLKQPNPIRLDTSTLTIPLGSTFIPQYQLVSSTPVDNKINLSAINLAPTNTIQNPLTSNILVNNKLNIFSPAQPSLISTNFNYNPTTNTQQIGKGSDLAILANDPIQLGSIKNGGFSFNLTQPMPNVTNMANKLVSLPNGGPVIHQLLLYPTTLNSTPDIALTSSPKQRSNSLPSESLHQLQRNSSLPIVINPMATAQMMPDSSSKTIQPLEKKTNGRSSCKDQVSKNDEFASMGNVKVSPKPMDISDGILPNNSSVKIVAFDNQTAPKHQEVKVDSQVKESFNSMFDMIDKTVVADSWNNSTLINSNDMNLSNGISNNKTISVEKPVTTDTWHNSTLINSNDMNLSNGISDNKVNNSVENVNESLQADSNNASNSMDLDFILDFDELNEELGDIDNNVLQSNEKMNEFNDNKSSSVNTSSKANNDMIDLSDNDWLESVFAQSFAGSTSFMDQSEKLPDNITDSSSTNSFMDTINQLFDSNPVSKSANYTYNNAFKTEPFLSTYSPMTSNNGLSCLNGPSQLSSQQQQCHFSANHGCNTTKYNCSNEPNNSFNYDYVNVDRFEDDYKNSIDFSMMVDKIDFAT